MTYKLTNDLSTSKHIWQMPKHYTQPSNTEIYFLQHQKNWLKTMPELLTKDNNTLEIGALYGAASTFMIENYAGNAGHHTIIDININDYIKSNLEPYISKCTYILGQSSEKMRSLGKESFDLVYIDGNHTSKYVLEDAVNAFYLTKNDGYIVFDDYGWGLDGHKHNMPKTGIDAFVHAYEKYLDIKSVGWQVILQKKAYELNAEEKSSNYIS